MGSGRGVRSGVGRGGGVGCVRCIEDNVKMKKVGSPDPVAGGGGGGGGRGEGVGW